MDKVIINLEDENLDWMIKKYFKGRTKVTIDELISLIEDLDDTLQNQEEYYENKLKVYEDNYEPISPYKTYGVSENDFH